MLDKEEEEKKKKRKRRKVYIFSLHFSTKQYNCINADVGIFYFACIVVLQYLCRETAKIGSARHNAQPSVGDSALAGTIFANKYLRKKFL